MPFSSAVAPICIGAFMAGLAALIFGLVGRKAHDHPYCHACLFDLFGHADPKICPECGLKFRKHNDIAHGLRQKRKGWVLTGTLMVAISVGTGVYKVGSAVWAGRALMPEWVLLQQFNHGDRRAAFGELYSRYAQSNLSANGTAKTVQAIIAVQTNPAERWVTDLYVFLQEARAAESITDDQWEAILLGGARLGLEVRDRVPTGGQWAISLDRKNRFDHGLTWSIASWQSSPGPWTRLTLEECTVNGQYFDLNTWYDPRRRSREPNWDPERAWSYGGGKQTWHTAMTLEPGLYTLKTRWLLEVTERDDPNGTVYSKTINLSNTFTVLPPEESTVTPLRDPSLQPQMDKSVTLNHVVLKTMQDTSQNVEYRLEVEFSLTPPPCPIAFDIIVRTADREWIIGSLGHPGPGGDRVGSSSETTIRPFDDGTVDIILRGSADAAVTRPDMTEYWDGEIVFENVPVERR
ncbi:MAG: hypothetical protein D8M59_10745 [Planctomycetes bacterium]|nr:hypothetical protein [Planctomycetota bacterium]